MNTCQIEYSAKSFALFPRHNYDIAEIDNNHENNPKNNGSISFAYPSTITIRAIDAEKWRHISENPLTERELCVLKMIVSGNSNRTIAEKLNITVGTTKTHVRNILRKLNVSERTQASVVALRSGLID